MKRSLLALTSVLVIAAVMVGCDKKNSGPVTVKKFDTYNDDILKFAVKYPSDWAKGIQPGSQVVFYTSTAVSDGFTQYKSVNGQLGAKIEVRAMLGGQEAQDKSIAELKAPFLDAKVFQAPQQTTFNGMPATKVTYSFDLDETRFTAERYYVMKDSVVTYFETAVIGNFADYAAVFDTARAAFLPGQVAARKPMTDTSHAAKDTDLVEAPAASMKPYSNAHFSIQYPSNFNPGTMHAGGAISSTSFSGGRNDSYFQVDVIEAKDNPTLDAVVGQNKKNYGGHAPSTATVGGAHGYVFNYNGGRDVSSRAYFVMPGKKIYRITMNWYSPQKDLYLPAFEKALATFQAK